MTVRPYWTLKQTSAPASEPITAAEAKTHIRETLSDSDNDSYIDTLVAVARHHVERVTGLVLITQTWELALESFPANSGREIVLPIAPVSAVAITYFDTNGDSQTWAASKYHTDFESVPGRVRPAPGEVYPGTQDRMGAVTVTITAGYGASSSDIPAPIIHAVKLLAAELYERREIALVGSAIGKVPFAVDSLLAPYNVWDWGHARW